MDFTEGAVSGELSIVVGSFGGRIEGTVEQAGNRRAAGVQVVAVPQGPRREQTRLFKLSFTDQSGHFELNGLAPGEYLVLAFDQVEPGAYQDPVFLKPLESFGRRVTVVEKSKESVVLKAIPAGTSSSAGLY